MIVIPYPYCQYTWSLALCVLYVHCSIHCIAHCVKYLLFLAPSYIYLFSLCTFYKRELVLLLLETFLVQSLASYSA